MEKMPEGFPLAPIDAEGVRLEVGRAVKILSVASCARGLPEEDQKRLYSLVGTEQVIVEFDRFGFVWLSFGTENNHVDFCLFPKEVLAV